MTSTLTADRVRELLAYEPETGHLIWRCNRGGTARAGSIAGAKRKDGYVCMLIDNRSYRVHRLVWLHVHGVWPKGVIDHINGDPSDNRLINLRDVTQLENSHNQRDASSNSNSGLLGVSFNKGRWRSVIHVQGKQKFLGSFSSADAAHAAYLAAKRRYHLNVPTDLKVTNAADDRGFA